MVDAIQKVHVASTPQPQGLQRLVQQLDHLHTGELDRLQPFSWSRCVLSIVSYALFFSDVIRSGLGYKGMPGYVALEPNSHVIFGPVVYPVVHLTTSNATEDTSMAYWPYKYDTTSASMRTVAEYLSVPGWTSCLLYKAKCDESSGISTRALFDKLDALVSTLQEYRPRLRSRRRGFLTIRIKMEFMDRLHDFLLPWIFRYPVVCTVQAISYIHSEVAHRQYGICGPPGPRPYACKHHWTRFSRSCQPYDTKCQKVGSIWLDITKRAKILDAAYPNRTLETAILERSNDERNEGLGFQGRRHADVVVITRVRDCSSSPCQTVAVDDYRYEVVTITKNVKAWYVVVAMLRVLGQAYAWIRIVAFFFASYSARVNETFFRSASIPRKLFAALRTVFLVPSQIVVYGSTFPIACYGLAHLLDGRLAHEMLASEYISTQGTVTTIGLERYVRINAVAMRGVWIVAAVCHVFLEVYTRRLWTPNRGIPGVPEFLISIVVIPTIFAHFRILSGRDTRVLELEKVATSVRRAAIQRVTFLSRHNFLSTLFVGGCTTDIKSVSCGICALLTVALLINTVRLAVPRRQQYKMTLITRTMVPCTAGSLWRANALVVSWDGAIFVKPSNSLRRLSLLAHKDGKYPSFSIQSRRRATTMANTPVGRTTTGVFQHHQKLVSFTDIESRKLDATVYLINVAVMSDPVTLLKLRILSHREVGFYESRQSQRCFLLPYPLHNQQGNLPIDWSDLNLLMIICTKDLEWWLLLQCG